MHRNTATKPLQKVPGHTHLFRRGARYYFRIGVPEPLRTFVGSRELVKSLNTADYRLAVERVGVEERVARDILHAAKVKLNEKPGKPQPRKPEILVVTSEKHAQELARAWFVELERSEAHDWRERRRTFSKEDLAGICYDLSRTEIAIAGGDIPVHPADQFDSRSEVRAFLHTKKLTMDEGSEGFRMLRRFFQEARLEHTRRHLHRVQDEPIKRYTPLFEDLDENAPTTMATTSRCGITIGQLGARFLGEYERANKAPKTLFQYRVTSRLLSEVFGDSRPAESVTREDAEKYCTLLETMPEHRVKRYAGMSVEQAIAVAKKRGDLSRLAPNTRRNRFFAAFSIFKYGAETKAIAENPFDDRLLKQRFTPKDNGAESEEQREPFSVEQLRGIFAAPLYTGCLDDERNYAKRGPNVVRRGRFFVPLIALLHGMRENEICQLHTADVCDWERGLFFEIRPGNGKRLKNKPSKRAVPVHPELLLIGFAEYVATRRADSTNTQLFPELKRAKSGSFSDNFSKWFARFLAHIFGEKIPQTFHSFRHSFTDACRVADLSAQRVDRLCGWASESRQQREYGRGKLIEPLAEDLARVRYVGLDLSHLYTSPVQTFARERKRSARR